MMAIIAAFLLIVAALIEVLLILGFPLGEFTMGGQYRVLPPAYRAIAAFSIIVQLAAAAIVLQCGGYMDMWFSTSTSKVICLILAGYFVLNAFMNCFSKSQKERIVMTPLAIIEAICFAATALQMP